MTDQQSTPLSAEQDLRIVYRTSEVLALGDRRYQEGYEAGLAARERSSALDVERYGRECNLAGRIAVLESLVNETPKRRSDLPEYWLADARAEYAHLTEELHDA